jgi:hypothetical protein
MEFSGWAYFERDQVAGVIRTFDGQRFSLSSASYTHGNRTAPACWRGAAAPKFGSANISTASSVTSRWPGVEEYPWVWCRQ